MLDAEADQLCRAERYERTEARIDSRAGHYRRKLHTKAGEVRWGTRRYMNMGRLREMHNEVQAEAG